MANSGLIFGVACGLWHLAWHEVYGILCGMRWVAFGMACAVWYFEWHAVCGI